MNAVMAILYRCALAIGGYVVACLAASTFINVVILGSAGLAADDLPVVVSGSFVVSIPIVALVVGYFAFFPTLLAILAGEFLGKHDWLFHALAGAVVAGILLGFDRSDGQGGAAFDLALPLVMIGAGMCGGIGYWLVAGRTPVRRREPGREVTSSGP